ncbi:rhodanese-like domain-containing protein [Salsuginibacillus kocurii]|uniref:rhodanese-like domain-containing protein n=1 Tax=Salsuginibacillus kocurii TaxID=427078 RepID=UPI000378FD3F|nr:rhodanese-like domain-containing protein [Salsuginibacillus kocurii]
MPSEQDGVKQFTVDELKEIYNREEGSPVLVDIREKEEYEEGHIPGVPLIPMTQIEARFEEFDPEREYLFICRSGRRSHNVSKYFKARGIELAHNYDGGMLEWDGPLATGLENVPEDAKDLSVKKGD